MIARVRACAAAEISPEPSEGAGALLQRQAPPRGGLSVARPRADWSDRAGLGEVLGLPVTETRFWEDADPGSAAPLGAFECISSSPGEGSAGGDCPEVC